MSSKRRCPCLIWALSNRFLVQAHTHTQTQTHQTLIKSSHLSVPCVYCIRRVNISKMNKEQLKQQSRLETTSFFYFVFQQRKWNHVWRPRQFSINDRKQINWINVVCRKYRADFDDQFDNAKKKLFVFLFRSRNKYADMDTHIHRQENETKTTTTIECRVPNAFETFWKRNECNAFCRTISHTLNSLTRARTHALSPKHMQHKKKIQNKIIKNHSSFQFHVFLALIFLAQNWLLFLVGFFFCSFFRYVFFS